MAWLTIIIVVISIIMSWHAYVLGSEKSAGIEENDRPLSQPTIFLQNTASAETQDSTDSAIKNLSLLFDKNSSLPDKQINLVTRRSLPVQILEPTGYGLYSYLLFGSSSDAGRQKRYAAASAYCKNIPLVSEGVPQGLSKKKMNIFQVLIKDIPNYCQNPETLIKYYDYTVAKKILQDCGVEGDGIYILADLSPIRTDCNSDPRMRLVMNLSTVNESLIEQCIIEFRRQTRLPNDWNDVNLRNLLLNLQRALPKVAEFIKFAKEAKAGER